jgi:hypothetical protein
MSRTNIIVLINHHFLMKARSKSSGTGILSASAGEVPRASEAVKRCWEEQKHFIRQPTDKDAKGAKRFGVR